MPEPPYEFYQVHEVLDRYIAIHDDIFKPSWRKAIPIPGIFKAIDYGQHFRDLSSLISALEQIADSENSSAEPLRVFTEYVSALLKTMQFLREMCRKLHEKSEGDLRSYKMQQYKWDADTYKMLVQEYLSLGMALNLYLRG